MEKNKSESTAKVNKSRRKLLDGLVKATPVITSMSVLPVWATNYSISGNMSGNTSGRDYQLSVVDGCSPGYFKAKNGDVSHEQSRLKPAAYSIQFSSIFPGGSSRTIEQVLTSEDTTLTGKCERLYMTAWLNAQFMAERSVAESARVYVKDLSKNDVFGYPYAPADIQTFYANEGITERARIVLDLLVHGGEGQYDISGSTMIGSCSE